MLSKGGLTIYGRSEGLRVHEPQLHMSEAGDIRLTEDGSRMARLNGTRLLVLALYGEK
jgi:hypothetical protein